MNFSLHSWPNWRSMGAKRSSKERPSTRQTQLQEARVLSSKGSGEEETTPWLRQQRCWQGGRRPPDKRPADLQDGSHGDRGVIRAPRSLSLDIKVCYEFQCRLRGKQGGPFGSFRWGPYLV